MNNKRSLANTDESEKNPSKIRKNEGRPKEAEEGASSPRNAPTRSRNVATEEQGITDIVEAPKEIDFCPICKEEIEKPFTFLVCAHKFHEECINTWLNEKNTCPTCRHAVREREQAHVSDDSSFDSFWEDFESRLVEIQDPESDAADSESYQSPSSEAYFGQSESSD